MTLSNRITLAGAIPLLVAVAVAVLVAAIALAPSKPASAEAGAGNCNLSPMFLDMLLDRYGMQAHQCNTLDLETPPNLASGEDADTWDFSGQELSSFAISDDDADILKNLTEDAVVEDGVRYIDLTSNPLTADDVSFKNIPNNVAVILSADSNVAGFQANEYQLTEGAAGYISAAFPDLQDDAAADMVVTVDISGDGDDSANPATGVSRKRDHVSFGVGTSAARTFNANSEADNVIFYWPITVAKDNENDEEWEITLSIAETASGIDNAVADFELLNDEADVTILDADSPTLSVCDRSEDVEEEILEHAAANSGPSGFGGNTRCDDITLRDLGTIKSLTIMDADDDDREAIEDLIAGDFEGMSGLTSLHIVGARTLPAGIFAKVGSEDDDSVEITFAANSPPGDSDAAKVGNFKPSTIPSHIWDDQETQQVIVLTDDVDADDKGVTSGFDADLYSGVENGHFFVLTNAATAAYILGNKVDFGQLTGDNPIDRPMISNHGAGAGNEGSRVVRFAIQVLPNDDEDKGNRNTWLFLFASSGNPTHAGNLVDLATVAVTDDD